MRAQCLLALRGPFYPVIFQYLIVALVVLSRRSSVDGSSHLPPWLTFWGQVDEDPVELPCDARVAAADL